jgi:hypothetical protein
MSNQRPTGVTLIAILMFLGGAMTILSSLCAFFTPLPGEASIIPILIGLVILVIGILYIAIGWGMWELYNWARITVIVLQALNLISLLITGALFIFGVDLSVLDPYLGTFGGTLSFPGVGIGFWVLAAVPAVIIWYLLTPDVQQAFEGGGGYYVSPPPSPPVYRAPLPPTEVAASPAPPPSRRAAPPLDPTRLVDQRTPVSGWLVIRSGSRAGKQLGLSASARNSIGRDASRCDLVLDDPAASREHARVQWEHGQFVLYDMASANGTWLNNNRVQRQNLMDGDVIRIGDTTMVFKSVK